MNEGKKSRFGWFIFFACCCYCAGSITLTMSIAGVFLPHLAEHSGLNIAEAAMWLTVMGPVSTIASPVWGHIIDKVNINVLTVFLACCQVAASIVFAFANSMATVILGGVLVGLSLSYIYGIVPATLMGNWFDERVRGRFMGIAFAFTGVGTFIFAPLFARLIIDMGLQNAYFVAAALAFVLLVPNSFIIKLRPEDKGLLPIGYVEGESNKNTVDMSGITLKEGLKTSAFWLFVFVYIGITCLTGWNSMMPSFAEEFLEGTMGVEEIALFGASMVSIAAVGNILSKLAFGWVSDKLGIMKASIIFYILICFAFIIWYFFSSVPTLAIGAFLLGFSNAIVSVGLPVLTQEVFGLRDFPKFYAWTAVPAQFINGSAATWIGVIFLTFGSYKYSMFLGLGLTLLALICTILMIPSMKNLRARWDTTENAEAEVAAA